MQKQKELEEQTLKNNNTKIPQSIPEFMSTSSSDTETLTSQLTIKDIYGNPISATVLEEGQKEDTTEDTLEDNFENFLHYID